MVIFYENHDYLWEKRKADKISDWEEKKQFKILSMFVLE